jgi:GNAT acetyltransferase-like protein
MGISDLARVLLDEPRWVETRFMLLSGEATVTGLAGDRRRFVAASTRWPLVAVVGRPDRAFVEEAAARAGEDAEILVAEEDGDWAEPMLAGWERIGATIHAWPGGVPLPEAPPADEARLLAVSELATFAHIPEDLQADMTTAATYAPIAGAFAGGAPVSFCYATAVTETLWDISVDTLDGYRERGLATHAVRCLSAALAARFKWPVWGAADDNAASLAAARSLGFEPAGRLAVFRRPL